MLVDFDSAFCPSYEYRRQIKLVTHAASVMLYDLARHPFQLNMQGERFIKQYNYIMDDYYYSFSPLRFRISRPNWCMHVHLH